MTGLSVSFVGEIPSKPASGRWLVDDLFSDDAVGILGGEPKSCKSFLALDIAVSVASGTPCLRRFSVRRRGTVLLFAAEDDPCIVRERVAGICKAAGISIDAIDLRVITTPVLHIDNADDQKALLETVRHHRPVLLIMDPLVRLHTRDENAVAEIAPLLAYLRQMQRTCHVSVLLVHHAKKGAGNTRAGQALRGSSELHAWGDCLLYVKRKQDALLLSVEHRAARAIPDLAIQLNDFGENALALHVVDRPPAAGEVAKIAVPADKRVLQALAEAPGPLTLRELRDRCRVRTETLCQITSRLVASQDVVSHKGRYSLPGPAAG